MTSKAVTSKVSELKVGGYGFADSFFLRVDSSGNMHLAETWLHASADIRPLKVELTEEGLVVTLISTIQKIEEPVQSSTSKDMPVSKLVIGKKTHTKFPKKLTYLELGHQPINAIRWMPRGNVVFDRKTGEATGTYANKEMTIEVFDSPTPKCIVVRRTNFVLQAQLNGEWYTLLLSPPK